MTRSTSGVTSVRRRCFTGRMLVSFCRFPSWHIGMNKDLTYPGTYLESVVALDMFCNISFLVSLANKLNPQRQPVFPRREG